MILFRRFCRLPAAFFVPAGISFGDLVF